MMYYTLTLITIFSIISPIFINFFLQHFDINTLYTQMPYSTVMKLYIICFFANVHTTAQFFAFFLIGEARMGGREYAWKTGHPQRFAMHIFSYVDLCSNPYRPLAHPVNCLERRY